MKLNDFVKLDFKCLMPAYGVIKMLTAAVVLTVFVVFMEYVFTVNIDAPLPMMTIGLIGILGIMLSFFPFTIEMKNDISVFAIIQNVPRKTIVNGRYFYGFIINLSLACYALIIQIPVLIIDGSFSDIKTRVIFTAVMFLFIQLYDTISYPIFFKLGYAKGQLIAMAAPILVIGLIGAVLSLIFSGSAGTSLYHNIISVIQSTKGPYFILGAAVLFTALLTYISIVVSQKFFMKREL
jgi:hypothetical protein